MINDMFWPGQWKCLLVLITMTRSSHPWTRVDKHNKSSLLPRLPVLLEGQLQFTNALNTASIRGKSTLTIAHQGVPHLDFKKQGDPTPGETLGYTIQLSAMLAQGYNIYTFIKPAGAEESSMANARYQPWFESVLVPAVFTRPEKNGPWVPLGIRSSVDVWELIYVHCRVTLGFDLFPQPASQSSIRFDQQGWQTNQRTVRTGNQTVSQTSQPHNQSSQLTQPSNPTVVLLFGEWSRPRHLGGWFGTSKQQDVNWAFGSCLHRNWAELVLVVTQKNNGGHTIPQIISEISRDPVAQKIVFAWLINKAMAKW